jgi:hypothetical protein
VAIRTSQAAKNAVRDDAAARALIYIEREIPRTLEAISFWVNQERLTTDEIMVEVETAYDITEEKTQHKIRLVIEAMVRERAE